MLDDDVYDDDGYYYIRWLMMMFISIYYMLDDDDDDVYYYIRWRLSSRETLVCIRKTATRHKRRGDGEYGIDDDV